MDREALEKVLAWVIVRHPMLRAAAEEPSERATDTGPFFHGGKDGRREHRGLLLLPTRWRWRPSNLTKAEIIDRALTVQDAAQDGKPLPHVPR